MTTRLNILLLLALIGSGLYLVKTSYDARRLFSELDKLQTEERRLASDHQRLLTERQAQATNLRVERVAREKLQMRPATPAVTQYVTDGGAR
jgi:cell division protein FtsL